MRPAIHKYPSSYKGLKLSNILSIFLLMGRQAHAVPLGRRVPWDLRRNSNCPALTFGNVTREEGEKEGSVVRHGAACHDGPGTAEKFY
jgi:hypothetical protein